MAQHLDDLVGADPQGRHAILRALRHERALPEARVEIADDLVLETRHGERCVVSHGRLNLVRRAQRGLRAALGTQRFAPRREIGLVDALVADHPRQRPALRSEEHTSELQSLMRISYAVFCLKKKKTTTEPTA